MNPAAWSAVHHCTASHSRGSGHPLLRYHLPTASRTGPGSALSASIATSPNFGPSGAACTGARSSTSCVNRVEADVAARAAPTMARFCAILMTLFHGARYSVTYSHLPGLASRWYLAALARSLASALAFASASVI